MKEDIKLVYENIKSNHIISIFKKEKGLQEILFSIKFIHIITNKLLLNIDNS